MKEFDADIIIVGGGAAGMAAAVTAAKGGAKTVLVERGDFCGSKNMFGGAIYTTPTLEVYPDFVGMDRSKVEEFCKEFKCVVQVEEQADNSKSPGTVISQSRAKGTDVVEGATITITVAKLDEKDLVPIEQEESSSSETTSSEESSN